ncbi:MAG TPA: Na+/H+ antiporter NhaA [Gemmatimonadota bacterium]|nr:Na+/H+ antiporter NhaA [Gemmatimonadota bacterium]
MPESRPIGRRHALRVFRDFVHLEASGGIVLLVCTIAALGWANSPLAGSYHALWETRLSIGLGDRILAESLLHWINDGLMALFFFVVGLEIKREIMAGELASPRRAGLPIAAAIGGMVVPAALYAALNPDGPGATGWGVPMATDIAFALAVITVLGDRIPAALKVFLTALAIVDDLGAILVIALFYSGGIAWMALGVGGAALAASLLANRVHVRHPVAYALLGLVAWLFFFQSGVHATVAGVLLAMTIPVRRRIDSGEFLARGQALLDEFSEASEFRSSQLVNQGQQEAIHALEQVCEDVETPLQRLEDTLHPWVVYGVLPLFALANAGVTLEGGMLAELGSRIGLGILLGLVIGKQLGITLFAWLGVRSGLAELPADIGWRQIYGVAWLGGIGFTMSLFIAGLAFGEGPQLATAKLAVLLASLLSTTGGVLILRRNGPGKVPVAQTIGVS